MCNFPSRQLLAEMHKAASLADKSDDPAMLTYACGFIKAAGDLRMAHEDLTGCGCWYEAVAEADRQVA